MFAEYEINYKNEGSRQHGILPVRRPSIPAPERRVTKTEIEGRDGVMIEDGETWGPIVIPVELNFMAPPERWGEVYRDAKKWLLKDTGNLQFADDPHYFYKVLSCQITDSERTSRKIGKFTAEFTCDPYTYMVSGLQEMDPDEEIFNYGEVSHPVYKITGNGSCTLTVNGKTMKATVGQNLTIDTDLMIAYREDGEMKNATVTGNYEDLYLQEGDNEVSITAGFGLKIVPNWRCI